MEPYEAINSLEASLRSLIQDVLEDEWRITPGINTEILEQRRTEESARRKGAAVEQNLLAYTHIYELRKIIEKSWDRFKPAFGERKRFDVYMDRIEDFRNAPMHSRQLLPFERELLSGIVGEIRNLATIYRSQQGPDRKYYPVLESIVDSFGTEINVKGSITRTNIRLQVGTRVEFSCQAWDSQDRELSWKLRPLEGGKENTATGNNVTLEWIVVDADVGESTGILIEMSSNGKYHRYPQWDDAIAVHYSVDPPENGLGINPPEPEASTTESTSMTEQAEEKRIRSILPSRRRRANS